MAGGLTKKELRELQQKFNEIDEDRSGYIEVNDLRESLDEDQANFVLSFLDADNDGQLTFDQYLDLFSSARRHINGMTEDKDSGGVVERHGDNSLHNVHPETFGGYEEELEAADSGRYTMDMIPVILGAMNAHPTDPGVQKQGLYAIRNLAAKEAFREMLLQEEAPELVVEALIQHKDDRLVVEEACRAMGLFALNEETARMFANENEAIPLIVEAMRKFQNSPELLLEASFALENLCCDEHICEIIARSGCIPTVMNGMRTHTQHAAFQSEACRLLGALSSRTETRVSVLNNGGAELLLQALKLHPDDAGVHQDACHALGSLALTNAEAWTRTVRERDNGLPVRVPVRRVGEPEIDHTLEPAPAQAARKAPRGRRSLRRHRQPAANNLGESYA